MTQARNIAVASGLVAFAAAGLAFPFYMACVSFLLLALKVRTSLCPFHDCLHVLPYPGHLERIP